VVSCALAPLFTIYFLVFVILVLIHDKALSNLARFFFVLLFLFGAIVAGSGHYNVALALALFLTTGTFHGVVDDGEVD
jgi:hypothetical protein